MGIVVSKAEGLVDYESAGYRRNRVSGEGSCKSTFERRTSGKGSCQKPGKIERAEEEKTTEEEETE